MRQYKSVAIGSVKGSNVRVVCGFDEETFEEIRARAVREKTSFAEQVRMLCEWGLMEGADQ